MEAGTVAPAAASTGSKTIADLVALAAERHGAHEAQRFKRDGEWHSVSYDDLGRTVSEIARGLIDLGIAPGDRVSLLCSTRPEWTSCDFAISSAGAVVVPVYPTNSPSECEWVAGNSESAAVVCEDATQVAKIVEARDNLPALRHIIVVDPAGDTADAIPLDDLRGRGRGRDEAELKQRREAVGEDDTYTIIYTSGTTGPPKGCVLSHRNYRQVVNMCEELGVLEDGDLVYLFLPLAHAYALLIQLLAIDLGGGIAYFGGDPKQIVPELMEVQPDYLPSVPRIFEKIYTLVTSNGDPDQIKGAVGVGLKVRALRAAGQEVPAELQAHYDKADEALFKNVCGVPVMEGYGMTETATVATSQTVEDHRLGSVGKALPGCEIRIADDGEVLIKGPNIFGGYYKNDDASFGTIVDGWLHTGDLGSLDEDGFLFITGRKKDIIITAGGKNLPPANIENDLKQSRFVSQAVMYGDRRPYPVALVTLDAEEIQPWARDQGLPDDIGALAADDRVRALIQEHLDGVNAKYAQVEQIKRFTILDHDLTLDRGEITPTLKIKRNVVHERYADVFDRLYA